jgi:hypothetical protein
MKKCSRCKEDKPKTEFYTKCVNKSTGHIKTYAHCKDCHRLYAINNGNEAKAKTEKRWLAANRKKIYGMTSQDFEDLFENQGGVCAICGKEETAKSRWGTVKTLSVDHCHNTNKIRGLLCDACNRGLGYFKDNPALLQTAIAYLENSG